MLVVRTDIHVQVAEDLATKTVLGEHAANGFFHHRERLARQLLFGSAHTLTPGVTRVTDVLFGCLLYTSDAADD